MKNLTRFVFACLNVFVFGTAVGFRFYEGEWLTGLVILFVLVWQALIFTGKWKYPYHEN